MSKKIAILLILLFYSLVLDAEGESMRFEIKKAEINGEEIAYHVYSEEMAGRPLLMIMGYGCTMDMWPLKLIEKLSAERPVIIFDNRGMGHSTGRGEYLIENFATDAAALLDYLDVDNADVFGWSMGGYTALQMAVEYPHKIKKLIVHAAMCGGENAINPPDEVWNSLTDMSGTIEERVGRMFSNLFPSDWLKENPDPSKYFPPVFEPVNDENIIKQAGCFDKWPGVYDELKNIRQQLLLITGDSDKVIPPENALIIAGQVRGASVVQIAKGGHGVMYQYPDQMADYINLFLKY